MLSRRCERQVTKGKDLVIHYFEFFNINRKPDKEVEYKVNCKCGWRGKYKTSRGYTNLQAHNISSHPEYTLLTDDSTTNQQLISDCFYSPKAKSSNWGWLDWVIGDLLPFSFVEKNRARHNCRLSPIGVDTFMKIMKLLTETVERKIIGLLPSIFALVFDGWTMGQTHYLGVFATFPDGESKSGYKQVLLSFSPLTNEESLNAENHT